LSLKCGLKAQTCCYGAAGSTELGHASRAIKGSDYEKVDCPAADIGEDGVAINPCQGVFPIGIKIGNDMIAVMVSASNPINGMSFSAAQTLFTDGNTQTFNQAVGTGPNVVPTLYIPDPLSGTFDFFLEEIGVPLPTSGNSFSNDEDLISGIGEDTSALGFTGLAFAINEPGIKIVAIDGVNPETLLNQNNQGIPVDLTTYKFFRPLFMYYDGNLVQSAKFKVQRYLCALLAPEGQQIVTDVGYVSLTAGELAVSQFSAGCSTLPPAETTIDVENPNNESAQLANCRDSREIVMLGSSTVSPVAIQLSTLNSNTFLYMTGRSAGSSVGIQSFLAGAETIGDASRALKGSDYDALGCDPAGVSDDGIALATCQGILPRGLLIGKDMLAVVINAGNTWADNLSFAQLVCLFQIADDVPKTATFASCGIPQAPANVPNFYVPDIQSGTRSFFDEEVTPVGIPGFVDDEVILANIEADPNGVGFFGLAFAKTVAADIIVFKIDGLNPLVVEDQANYALGRPLYMYYDASVEGQRFEVDFHLCFMLSEFAQNVVESVGYVRLEESEIADTKDTLGLAC